MDSEAITITQHVDAGVPGEDSDPFNPLARATRALLHDGSSFRSAAPVFVGDGTALRWLGLFVESDQGLVVFFPGLARQPDLMGYHRTGHPEQIIPHLADHVTLEPDRTRWHSTEYAGSSSRKRGKRGRGPRQRGLWTWPIGEGRVLWFGMSIPTAEVLRFARGSTVARAPAPSNRDEVVRRMKVFDDAIYKGAMPPVLTAPSPPPSPTAALHFSVVVAPVGAPEYTGGERGLPLE